MSNGLRDPSSLFGSYTYMWQASNRENEEKRIRPENTISADVGGDEYTCLRSLDERGWMWSIRSTKSLVLSDGTALAGARRLRVPSLRTRLFVDGVNARARTVSPRADFNNVVLTIFVIAAGA
jgi:hypothetical protein